MSLDDAEGLLLFESTALGDAYGYVATVPADAPEGPRQMTELQCERVDFRTARGLCLRANRGAETTYEAVVFDERLAEVHRVPLAGPPSRTRVSPDGTLGAATVFVTGHAYKNSGFSTETILIDLAERRVIAAIETDFTVLREGEVWKEEDFNFWGVTFVDDNEFYATLGTGGVSYLVLGDLEGRELVLLERGVECPSLSPDGGRLAYKRPVETGEVSRFQLEVLDLETRAVTVLGETRSVDDQAAWFDNNTIMYGLPDPDSPAVTDTWTVPADGSGDPTLILSGAWSTNLVDR